MLHVIDAGLLAYRPAWDLQLQVLERVLSGELPAGALILVEHPPVITVGRREGAQTHLLASPKMLEHRGVELVETDRGGDITFHGPGQLVAYPIIPLNAYKLNLHAYLRLMEQAVIDTLAGFGVESHCDPMPERATGVWVRTGGELAKICAIGIKVRRWVSFHGLALNVTTDLSYFDLINPCGLSRPVTSVGKLLGPRTPPMDAVKSRLTSALEARLGNPNSSCG